MTEKLKTLLDDLTVIDQFTKDDYQRLHYMKIITVTEKATLIDDRWIPKSQMATDVDGNLYVTHWMYDKLEKYNNI